MNPLTAARRIRPVPAWLLANERRSAANLHTAYWELLNDGRDDDARLVLGHGAPMGLTVGLRALGGIS